jgi:hypothetical protein
VGCDGEVRWLTIGFLRRQPEARLLMLSLGESLVTRSCLHDGYLRIMGEEWEEMERGGRSKEHCVRLD